MQMNNENSEQNRLLNSIAETSRQSVNSMSDIVWAINPKRDSLLEMVRKMREYAEEIFVPKNIHVKFVESETNAKIKLPMHLRRDLYLIFKEAVNNIAKHAKCTKVMIDFKIEHHEIILKIEDNGIGFDRNNQISGNGLANMQTRVDGDGSQLTNISVDAANLTGVVPIGKGGTGSTEKNFVDLTTAHGYLLKNTPPAQIIQALTEVLNGGAAGRGAFSQIRAARSFRLQPHRTGKTNFEKTG